jgi:hypothetical protein
LCIRQMKFIAKYIFLAEVSFWGLEYNRLAFS